MEKADLTRKSMTRIATLLLLFSLGELQVIAVADANMYPISWIKINSPLPSVVYQNSTVVLDVCLGNQMVDNPVATVTYSLDSAFTIKITNITKSEYQLSIYKVADYTARTLLENLKPGNHSLVVYTLNEHGGGRTAVVFRVASPVASNSLEPSPTPTVPEFPAIAVLPLILTLVLVGVAVIVRYRKVKCG